MESNVSLFTDAFLSETFEKLLGNLDALRGDFKHLSGGAGDEKLIKIVQRLDDIIVEYESVSGNFLKVIRTISSSKELDGAMELLLAQIYDDILRDRVAILNAHRGTDLELAGLMNLQPNNSNGRSDSRPPESIGTY